MSKSRGTFITADSYLPQGLNPEWLRYYYAAKLNGTMEDIDLNLDDFIARVNSDLVGKFVNIASRTAGFIHKQIRRPPDRADRTPPTGGRRTRNDPARLGRTDRRAYEARDYAKALREIMALADRANQYVSTEQTLGTGQETRAGDRLHEVCTVALNASVC